MDEFAYERYMADAKKADELQRVILELYGFGTPWKQAYFMAIKDKLLSKDDKNLLKEFHPIK